jgi:4-amino-4-deoxy-L-arabinose transferase-like glycosyltransferase
MRFSKKEIIFLGLLILVSILVVVWIYPDFSSVGTDGAINALIGKNIVEGQGFSLFGEPHLIFPPLLPILIAFFFRLTSNLELSAHLSVISFALLSIPLFYLLVRELFSEKVAAISTAFLGFNGTIVWSYSTFVNPGILVASFLLASILILLKTDKNIEAGKLDKIGLAFFILGVFIGLAYLARPEFFFLFPILMFFNYYRIFQWGKLILILSMFLAGFLIVSLPYICFLHNNLGYWTISGKTNGLALLFTEVKNSEELERPVGDKLLTAIISPPPVNQKIAELIWSNKFFFLKSYFKNLNNIQRYTARTFGILMLFLGLGLREFIIRRRLRELTIILLFLTPVLVAAFGVGDPAYYTTHFYPLLIIFVGLGVSSFHSEVSSLFKLNRFRSRMLLNILMAALISYSFFPVIQGYFFLPENYKPEEFKFLGTWMASNISGIENEIILARKPDVSFYSGAKWQIIPYVETYEELIRLMKVNRIKYLVADDRYFKETRPQFKELLNPLKAPKNFELIKSVDYKDMHAYLYKLK